MGRGFINASEARQGFTTNILVLNEINNIENNVLIFSNNGFRELIVDFTEVTNKAVFTRVEIESVDIDDDFITVTDHGFETGDTVEFIIDNIDEDELPEPLLMNKEYSIIKLTDDTFKVLSGVDSTTTIDFTSEGEGDLYVRKIIESEKFYKAWKQFYIYPNASSYTIIMSNVEEHFKGLGYSIVRYENATTKTLYWKVTW